MSETATPAVLKSFARENTDFNRAWFKDLQERVAAGEPLAYVHINTPTEIYKAMGIHVIVNQWWSAVVGSRGKTTRYKTMMAERGYRTTLCNYCSVGLSSLLETEPEEAPWGGLPKPTVLVSGAGCSSVSKVFDIFADEFDIPHYQLEIATNPNSIAPKVDRLADEWRTSYDPRQFALYVEQYKGLIRFLEMHTGQTFSESKFRRVLELVDEQENYYRKTRDLISEAEKTPLNIADQLPATIIPQWHRGTEWARDRARLFYETTKAKVDAGEAACPNEKIRLMWLGVGLWHNMGFYTHFEQEYGAVFNWNEYLSLGADGYRVETGPDLLETLAGRMVNVMTVVAQDTWYASQARKARLDGIVIMAGGGAQQEGGVCPSQFGRPHRTEDALRRAGFPVLVINGDPVNPAGFDDEVVKARVARFLEDEVIPWQAAGRPLAPIAS